MAWHAAVQAADLVLDPGYVAQDDTMLPAVSGVNGKWEFDPGLLSGAPLLRAAGSLSAPLGDRFGIQADGMVSLTPSDQYFGGALHAFTRDPSSYLFGVTAGVVVQAGQATLAVIGPEAELYMDRLSFEGWGGFATINYVDPAMLDKTGAFAIADVAYYATDDFRLAVGGSYVLGDLSLHASAEYQFQGLGMPLSLTGDARLHTDGNYTLTAGLKGYFGGDPQKSLIERHRQDDPPNRALSLFFSAQSVLGALADTVPIDGEAACLAVYGTYGVNDISDPESGWQYSTGECFVNNEVVWPPPQN